MTLTVARLYMVTQSLAIPYIPVGCTCLVNIVVVADLDPR